MSTTPSLHEQDIRERIDERSFQRSLEYFRKGAIVNPRRQGMLLKAF